MKRRFTKIFNILLTLALTAVILIGGAMGCDCKFNFDDDNGDNGGGNGVYSVSFRNDISLLVGEQLIVSKSHFSFTGDEPQNFDYTLSSSNESIFSVTGKTITAKKVGEAVLTATDKNISSHTMQCNVIVTTPPNHVEFALATRSRHYNITDGGEVDIYAQINGGLVDASPYNFTWKIDGVQSSYRGDVLTLPAPTAPKTVEVTAEVSVAQRKYTDKTRITWATPFAAPALLSKATGNLTQTENGYSPVKYALDYDKGDNGLPAISWFVNGVESARDSDDFTFTPSALGAYKITAEVNGVTATATDNTVLVSGSRVPSGVSVDYDSLFPSVKVHFAAGTLGETFKVRATNLTTNQTHELQTAGDSVIFDDSDVDLTAHAYSFEVMSLGSEALSPSAYSEAVSVNKLTGEEITYLNKQYFDGNYYVTSDNELYDIYDYFMLYRSKPILDEDRESAPNGYGPNTENYTDTHSVYLAYTSTKSISSVLNEAFNRANYTGSYKIEQSLTGKVLTLKFNFRSSSAPVMTYTTAQISQKALNGNVPHVSTTGRTGDSLPIDSVTTTAEVSTTDQLYRVLEMGYRPLPTNGSKAQAAYNYARALLKKIIDDEMDDVSKAHAIYDWIMWRVYYDNKVTSVADIQSAVTYASFYIEGVLTDKNFLAVCDGMSKTYSLLCNMEGIPCLRIAGEANTGSGYGGHAWNKVFVNNAWYIVDCTWGDDSTKIGSTVYEMASHRYFLKTDGEMSTHLQNEHNDYPSTTTVPYNYFAHAKVSGNVNRYLSSSDEVSAFANAVALIAASELADGEVRYEYKTECTCGGGFTHTQDCLANVTVSDTLVFEFMVADSADEVYDVVSVASKYTNPVANKLNDSDLTLNIIKHDNVLVYLVKKG